MLLRWRMMASMIWRQQVSMSIEAKLKEWVAGVEHGDAASARTCAARLCQAAGGAVPDAAASLALMYGVSKRPKVFRDPEILSEVLGMLRPPKTEGHAGGGDTRGAILAHRLACNVLARSYRDCSEWPVEFIQAYMDDALGPRSWVEDAGCKIFLDNISTAWDRKVAQPQGTTTPSFGPTAAPTGLGSASSSLSGASPRLPSMASAGEPPSMSLADSDSDSGDEEVLEVGVVGRQNVAATPSDPGPSPREPPTATPVQSSLSRDSDSDSGEEEVLEMSVVGPETPQAAGASSSTPSATARVPAPPPSTGGASSSLGPGSDSDSGDEEVLEMGVVGVDSPHRPPGPVAMAEPVLPAIWPRYQRSQEAARLTIANAMENRLNPNSGPMGQVISTLTDLVASPFCRCIAVEYLERWLSTPAQSQKAKALFAAVIKEVDPASSDDDAQVIQALFSLKLPLQQERLFTEGLALLVQKHLRLLQKALRFFLTEGIGDSKDSTASSSSSSTTTQQQTPASHGSFKSLARILAQALPQQQDGRRPSRTQWLTKATVGRELACLIKEFALQGQGPQAQEACLATVKALTLDNCDLLRLVGELLVLPPELLKRPDSSQPAQPRAVLRNYVRGIGQLVAELFKHRSSMVTEASKAINEHFKKEQKSRSMPEADLRGQMNREHWRIRLALINEVAEIHALVARFCVQVAEQIPGALSRPPEASGSSSSSSSSSSSPVVIGDEALSLFRSMIAYVDTVEKGQRGPEPLLNTYVGVKDGTVRALVRLATGTKPLLPAETVLQQLEILIDRAADVLAKKEKDPATAALLLTGSGASDSCIELGFPDDQIVQELFSLARFTPQSALDSQLAVYKQPLAYASIFWRVSLLLVIVSGSNPASVGRWLWHRCPTLRCLMQMVVCSQYQFPPPGAATILPDQNWPEGGAGGGGAGFSAGERKMLLADADLADEEARLMSIIRGEETQGMASFKKKKKKRIRQHLWGEDEEAVARTTRSRTKAAEMGPQGEGRGGSSLPRIMLLDLSMSPRKPPPDVLQRLKELDERLNIGARFRRSTEPDFVAAAIAGDDSTRVSRVILENSIGWLAPAVAAEPDVTMKRLPLGVICYMLMMAYMDDTHHKSATATTATQPDSAATPMTVEASKGGAAAGDAKGATGGADASHDALVRLRGPLRTAAAAALTGEGAEEYHDDKAVLALGYFLTEVRHQSSKRRSAARKALESILGSGGTQGEGGDDRMDVDDDSSSQGGGIGQAGALGSKSSELRTVLRSQSFLRGAAHEDCSWVFNLDRLPSFRSSPTAVLDALASALEVEASHYVISYYLLALYDICHGASGQEASTEQPFNSSQTGSSRGNLKSPTFFSWVLCTALARRKLVMQATSERFPLLQSLIMEEVFATLQEAATTRQGASSSSQGPSRLWKGDRQVRILLPGCRDDEPVLLPYAVLQACIAVLSVSTSKELPGPLVSVLEALFPSPSTQGPTDVPAAGKVRGAAGATLASGEDEPALSAEDWVHLAKCACPAVSEGTSRCMPALLLCRLLLCSGLSDHCFRGALERIDQLGRMDSTGEAYRDLLSPASTSSWGMARALGTRKALTRKLFRRVTAYLRLQAASGVASGAQSSGRFLEWLNREVASAEMETQKDHCAESSAAAAAAALTVTSLPHPAPPTCGAEQQARSDIDVAAMLMRMAEKPPSTLLPSPRSQLLTEAQSGVTSRKLPQFWSEPEDARAQVNETVVRVKASLERGTVQAVRASLDDLSRLLNLARGKLSSSSRRGVKRRLPTSMNGEGTDMEVEQEKDRPPLPTEVATQALDLLHAYVSGPVEPSDARPFQTTLLAGFFTCDICRTFMTDASLGPRCQDVLWSLLFASPAAVSGPTSSNAAVTKASPPLRAALLSYTLRTLTPDQIDLLAHRILHHQQQQQEEQQPESTSTSTSPSSSADLHGLDLQSAVATVAYYMRHPGASPMAFEIGSSPFTGPLLAKLTTIKGSSRPSEGGGLSLRSPSNLSTLELSSLLSMLLSGQQPSDFVAPFCLKLIQRNPLLCGPVASFLLTTIRSAAPPPPPPNAMEVDNADATSATQAVSTCSVSEKLLLSIYLGFPSGVAPVFKSSRMDARGIVTMLCRGQSPGDRPRLAENYFERRLRDDVAQLCRLGSDPRLDSEAVNSLCETAKRHPFLLLRHLPALTHLLDADASAGSLKDDPLMAPFYLRKRAPVPPDAVLTASMAGSRAGYRIRFAHWGSNIHLGLWQQLLVVVCEVPAKVLLAFFIPGVTPAGAAVLNFLSLYFRLLAASKAEEVPSMLTERLNALLNLLRKEKPDVIDKFTKTPVLGSKDAPADLLAKFTPKG